MEEIIGDVLRYGVLLSFAVVLIGVVLLAVQGNTGYAGNQAPGRSRLQALTDYHAASSGARWPLTPTDVVTGVAHGHAYAVIALGLLVLIATPVIRVGASIIAFAWEKDRTYVVITSYVFVVLIVSFVIGKGG
jgi:uncharacterized membrane protein